MKMKTLSAVVLIIIFALLQNAHSSSIDFYPSIEIPVMNGGYNLTKVFDNPKYTKSLNYFIKADYPANSVIEFYNLKFEELGWKVNKDGNNSYEWQSFIDGTVKGKPYVRHRMSTWVKHSKKIQAHLFLRYEKHDKKHGDLHVLCQIQPLVDTSKLELFLENLQNTNADIYPKFMELIENFTKKNGEIDIDKYNHIVHTNKDLAAYLIESKKLTDEVLSEIKEVLIKNK
jgi:hypothetical protein